MPSPTTQSTTHTNKRERQSCGAPHGMNADLGAFLGQCAAIATVFAVAGAVAVWFALQPAPVKAMLVYGAIVAGCGLAALASLRRRVK